MPLENLDDLEAEWAVFMEDRAGRRGQWTQDQRWRADNPGELAALVAYRAGGPRPTLATATGRRMVEHLDAYLEAKADPEPPPPPAPSGLLFALGSNGDMVTSANTGQSLGAKLMRTYDRSPGASVDALERDLLIYQTRGIEPLILFSTGGMNTSMGEVPGNLQTLAAALGPGGSRAHPTLAPRFWEIGNELFYKYAPKPGPEYADEYAAGFVRAAQALRAGNQNVEALFVLDTDAGGGAQYQRIVDLAAPSLAGKWDLVGGWVFHTYGPMTAANVTKVADLLARIEAKGAPKTIPVFVTEDGIATDDGVALSNNYGWPTNLTYQQAGAAIRGKLRDLQAHPVFGSRLRVWTHYQARDQRAHGSGTDREWFFGVTRNDGTAKGDLTQSVRDHTAAYRG